MYILKLYMTIVVLMVWMYVCFNELKRMRAPCHDWSK